MSQFHKVSDKVFEANLALFDYNMSATRTKLQVYTMPSGLVIGYRDAVNLTCWFRRG
jgi:hypothetical protein